MARFIGFRQTPVPPGFRHADSKTPAAFCVGASGGRPRPGHAGGGICTNCRALIQTVCLAVSPDERKRYSLPYRPINAILILRRGVRRMPAARARWRRYLTKPPRLTQAWHRTTYFLHATAFSRTTALPLPRLRASAGPPLRRTKPKLCPRRDEKAAAKEPPGTSPEHAAKKPCIPGWQSRLFRPSYSQQAKHRRVPVSRLHPLSYTKRWP